MAATAGLHVAKPELTSFKGSNSFSCLNADLSACAGKPGMGEVVNASVESQKSAQAVALDVMTESFDQLPSRHNSGIRDVGKSKSTIQFDQTMDEVTIANMILLLL